MQRTGTVTALPSARVEDPSSRYTAVFTDARGDYTLVIGLHIGSRNGRIYNIEGNLTVLTVNPHYLRATGHLFNDTMDLSEHSGSTVSGTASRHELDGFVGITEENGQYIAAFYGRINRERKNFVIPTIHKGHFPYCDIKESELEKMRGLYENMRRERSINSVNTFKKALEELFVKTEAGVEGYVTLAIDAVPETLKRYPIWPDVR